MENRNMEREKLMRDLISEFVGETENEFYEMVYDWYYQTVAESFKDEVEEYCKIVIFGDEYAMSVQELYTYDSYLAIETWRNYVSRALDEDFCDWANEVLSDDIEAFAAEFQQWLASQDDERASDAIVALMSGEIDLTKIIVDWLCGRLGYGTWRYPA